VITMLPNSPQMKEVALGPGGIVEAARPGLVVIDTSSIARSPPARFMTRWPGRA
jgi:2-hydroxy-3-oxopropionate reductase